METPEPRYVAFVFDVAEPDCRGLDEARGV